MLLVLASLVPEALIPGTADYRHAHVGCAQPWQRWWKQWRGLRWLQNQGPLARANVGLSQAWTGTCYGHPGTMGFSPHQQLPGLRKCPLSPYVLFECCYESLPFSHPLVFRLMLVTKCSVPSHCGITFQWVVSGVSLPLLFIL